MTGESHDNGSSDSMNGSSNVTGETLLSVLKRDEIEIHLETSTLDWRERIHQTLRMGVTHNVLKHEVTPSHEALKLSILERITDAYLQAGRGKIDDTARRDFYMVIEEAVANAFRDGNKLDGNKNVILYYGPMKQKEKRFFCIYIEDEGKGFLLSAVPSPFTSDGLLKESGRGLLMMNYALHKLGGKARFLPIDQRSDRSREVFIHVPLPE